MLPDLDVLAFRFHMAYGEAFGHRGASHSLAAAVLIGLIGMALANHLKADRRTAFVYIAVCVASHGLLDMFTNGGLGPALWWPFSDVRVFAPCQVIEVAPLSLRRMFSAKGLKVMQSEMLWIWLPAILVCTSLVLMRRRRMKRVT